MAWAESEKAEINPPLLKGGIKKIKVNKHGKRQILMTVEDIFFVKMALNERITEYRKRIKEVKKLPYSREKDERINTLVYFVEGFKRANKAVMASENVSGEREKQKGI
jgi:hypothetical protein